MLIRSLVVGCLTFLAFCGISEAIRAEPDKTEFCAPRYPIHPPATNENYDIDDCHVVGTWSNMDQATIVAKVDKGTSASIFQTVPLLSIANGGELTGRLDAYVSTNPITSFVLMKEGKIFYEKYQYGRKASDQMLGQSMTKSVMAIAGLAALSKGTLSSLDVDVNSLTKDFVSTAYGASKLRHLITMSSGVDFPIGPALWTTPLGQKIDAAYYFGYKSGGPRLFKSITKMRALPGKEFAYSNGDVLVFSEALKAAVGESLSSYFSSAVWKKIGAERPGYFLTDTEGRTCAYGGFNATARDWGRLGLLIANKGRLNGRQIIREDLVVSAISGSRAKNDYGFYFWLNPNLGNVFMMSGYGGQFVVGSQDTGVVLVQTAVFVNGREANTETIWSLFNEAQKILSTQ